MAMNIEAPAVAISASTTTARAELIPTGSALRFVRVTNTSATSGCYVNGGGSGVNATNANICLAPFESAVFERNPLIDTHVAALLISGTGIVSCSLVAGAD